MEAGKLRHRYRKYKTIKLSEGVQDGRALPIILAILCQKYPHSTQLLKAKFMCRCLSRSNKPWLNLESLSRYDSPSPRCQKHLRPMAINNWFTQHESTPHSCRSSPDNAVPLHLWTKQIHCQQYNTCRYQLYSYHWWISQVQEMACQGRNWGTAEIESSTLVFKVASKPAFRVPLRDVGQVQQASSLGSQSCNFWPPPWDLIMRKIHLHDSQENPVPGDIEPHGHQNVGQRYFSIYSALYSNGIGVTVCSSPANKNMCRVEMK